MSLIFFLVRRALTRAFGDIAHPTSPKNKSSTTETHQNTPHDIIETIWVGMPENKLRATFGPPIKTETCPTGEIWIYNNLNGQGTQTAITLENGTIVKWQDVMNPLPFNSNISKTG